MRSPRRGAAARDCLDWDERIVSLFQVYFSKRACWNSGRGADRTSVQAATFCTIGCARPHVAVFAAARISSSFLKASFLQSFAFRRRNSRSFSSPVRAAYHSHWQACSKHSAMVGEMRRRGFPGGSLSDNRSTLLEISYLRSESNLKPLP